MKKWMIALGMISLTLSACSTEEPKEEKENDIDEVVQEEEKKDDSEVTQEEPSPPSEAFYKEIEDLHVDHIHGLGYPASGDALMVASHHGPVLFEDGVWKEATSEKHDYMGFQAVADGFVSSGHPEPGSDYENPLGLLKSTNYGETFKQYTFAGEIDFHYLAASYNTNRIYVFNEMPTDELANGFFYTDDYGTTMTAMDMGGFEAKMMSNIAAHPENPETLAIGTERGLYVSTDSGDSFSLVNSDLYITYVTLSSTHAFVATVNEKKKVELHQIELDSNEGEKLSILELTEENAITFIAQHPTNEKELSFVTLQNDVYQSTDGGTTWSQLLAAGKVINE